MMHSAANSLSEPALNEIDTPRAVGASAFKIIPY